MPTPPSLLPTATELPSGDQHNDSISVDAARGVPTRMIRSFMPSVLLNTTLPFPSPMATRSARGLNDAAVNSPMPASLTMTLRCNLKPGVDHVYNMPSVRQAQSDLSRGSNPTARNLGPPASNKS